MEGNIHLVFVYCALSCGNTCFLIVDLSMNKSKDIFFAKIIDGLSINLNAIFDSA